MKVNIVYLLFLSTLLSCNENEDVISDNDLKKVSESIEANTKKAESLSITDTLNYASKPGLNLKFKPEESSNEQIEESILIEVMNSANDVSVTRK
ncbi:MAG: hypothetical protein HRT58_12340 [Crocinitomicaceae bacterium]|nr:hypothetical protein [Flavobacteriales bacterium]NQZ36451.1 hypothetical protein [Crocinitomicaceae bacterium]